MVTVYDVRIGLSNNATLADIRKLKDHFKALKIDAIGLDPNDFKPRAEELSFTIYGDFGPFMMKRMVTDCTENIFPGSNIGLSHNV
jgi:hypothetical protein